MQTDQNGYSAGHAMDFAAAAGGDEQCTTAGRCVAAMASAVVSPCPESLSAVEDGSAGGRH